MKNVALLILIIFMGLDEVPKVQIGQSVRVGGIEFTPVAVELRRIVIKQPGWPGARTTRSEEPYTVLVYRMANVTEEQAIDPGVVKARMEDQYGNSHKLVENEDVCSGCVIIEPNRPVELLPGDSQKLVVVLQAPKIKKAELFTIKLTFAKDNKGDPGEAWVQFQRSDIGQ
jgi:hypothetical protein